MWLLQASSVASPAVAAASDIAEKPGPNLGGHTTNHPLFPMLGTCSRDASDGDRLLFSPYLLRSISGELPSSASASASASASPASWLCRKLLLPCTGCSAAAHVHGLLDPAPAWLSASEEEEDVTQLPAERRRGGDGESEEEEDRHPDSTAEASSEGSGEPTAWSARTSSARRSTDCRYLPCASILSCRCRWTCRAKHAWNP